SHVLDVGCRAPEFSSLLSARNFLTIKSKPVAVPGEYFTISTPISDIAELHVISVSLKAVKMMTSHGFLHLVRGLCSQVANSLPLSGCFLPPAAMLTDKSIMAKANCVDLVRLLAWEMLFAITISREFRPSLSNRLSRVATLSSPSSTMRTFIFY